MLESSEIEDIIDSLALVWKFRPRRYFTRTFPDRKHIQAKELINHVEHAITSWKEAPWCESISFDMFCEYILPLKSTPGPPQLGWRDLYAEHLSWVQDSFSISSYYENPMKWVLDSTSRRWKHTTNYRAPPSYGPVDLWHINAGNCHHHTSIRVQIAWSLGMPAAHINIPQWANQRAQHAFIGIPHSNGEFSSFGLDRFLPELIAGKIYMKTFTPNSASLAMQLNESERGKLPPKLSNPCIKDVTEKFIPTINLEVDLFEEEVNQHEFVFLSFFNPKQYWVPVDWTKPVVDKAIFKDIGRHVLVLPSSYDGKKVYPIGNPIFIEPEGHLTEIALDTSSWMSVKLRRKYPLRLSYDRYTSFLKFAIIESAGNSSFEGGNILDTIRKEPGADIMKPFERIDRYQYKEYWDSIEFSTPIVNRYFRMRSHNSKDCYLGELEFFGVNGDKLVGRAFGNASNPEYIQDGFHGEAYRDTIPGSWVGIDFGTPVSVKKIRWLPADDSNSIQTGDEYELLYWDGYSWVSLGKKVATLPLLNFKVPKRGLLWLKCLSRGQEERPFTIDLNTKTQVFY
jgi:hypothetical protein